MSSFTSTPPVALGIDPRGPRFSASLTSVVLALALVTPFPVSVALLVAQAAVFAVGATQGVQHTPYAHIFRGAGPPAPRGAGRTGGPSSAALRPGPRPGVRRGGRRRPAGRRHHRRPGSRWPGPGGGAPQRGLRPVPGLRALPDPPAGHRPV